MTPIGDLKDGDGMTPQHRYYLKHKDEPIYKEKRREASRKSHLKHRDAYLANNRVANRRIKLEVLEHYSGGAMVCRGWDRTGCPSGCSDVRCFVIDHINGGGEQQRRKFGEGNTFYRWLRKNGYPPGYQVLCANCNAIKAIELKERQGNNKRLVVIAR